MSTALKTPAAVNGNKAMWAVISLLATIVLAVAAFVGRQAYANALDIAATKPEITTVKENLKEIKQEQMAHRRILESIQAMLRKQ